MILGNIGLALLVVSIFIASGVSIFSAMKRRVRSAPIQDKIFINEEIINGPLEEKEEDHSSEMQVDDEKHTQNHSIAIPVREEVKGRDKPYQDRGRAWNGRNGLDTTFWPTRLNKTEIWHMRRIPSQREVSSDAPSRIPPPKRGGRPRGPTDQQVVRELTPPRPIELMPELIVVQIGDSWVVGVEVTGSSRRFRDSEVRLDEHPIQLDTQRGFYPLPALKGHLAVKSNHSGYSYYTDLSNADFFLFKISGPPGLQEGRRVKFVTRGFYLAAIPTEWKPDQQSSKVEFDGPIVLDINGFQGYCFKVINSKEDRIIFRNGNGLVIVVDDGESRFRFVGKRIKDDSLYAGPLFSNAPPELGLRHAEDNWDDIWQVVLVQEGKEFRGMKRWRDFFILDNQKTLQGIPLENVLSNKNGGWFSARIYNHAADLVESVDFRFLRGLSNIEFIQKSRQLHFKCSPYCLMELIEPFPVKRPKLINQKEGVWVTIPDSKEWAVNKWKLVHGDSSVELRLVINPGLASDQLCSPKDRDLSDDIYFIGNIDSYQSMILSKILLDPGKKKGPRKAPNVAKPAEKPKIFRNSYELKNCNVGDKIYLDMRDWRSRNIVKGYGEVIVIRDDHECEKIVDVKMEKGDNRSFAICKKKKKRKIRKRNMFN